MSCVGSLLLGNATLLKRYRAPLIAVMRKVVDDVTGDPQFHQAVAEAMATPRTQHAP